MKDPIEEKAKDCPFCKMFSTTVLDLIDIEPLNPVVKGHRIIIPREHVRDFTEDAMVTARVAEFAAELAREIGGDFNLITSKGVSATQSVFHLHVHLVPRKNGDGLLLPWTGEKALYEQGKKEAIDECIEAVPPANNPANAIMDDRREGENHMRKVILTALEKLKVVKTNKEK